MSWLKQWQEKIDNLSLRERGAVLFCTLFVVYFVWDTFLMQPLQVTEKRVKSQLQQKQAEQFALNIQLQKLDISKRDDPDREDRERLQLLRSQLTQIELQVQESTKHLISPKDMAAMLEAVLLKVKGLELLQIRGLGGAPLVEATAATTTDKLEKPVAGDDTVPKSVVDNAYKHGLNIVFEGDYMSTLEYIQALENLGWGFFWESLELEVKDYPDSRVSITVFTLSLDKNWIGV